MSMRSNFILNQTCKRPLIGKISVGCNKQTLVQGGGGGVGFAWGPQKTSAWGAKFCEKNYIIKKNNPVDVLFFEKLVGQKMGGVGGGGGGGRLDCVASSKNICVGG